MNVIEFCRTNNLLKCNLSSGDLNPKISPLEGVCIKHSTFYIQARTSV
jgi:hypothetical protein